MPPGLLEPASVGGPRRGLDRSPRCSPCCASTGAAPRRFSPVVLPGFLFVALPWVLPAPVALAAFLVGHLLWFAACERAFPPPDPVPPGYTEVRVLGVEDQTDDIRTFRLERPRGFDFKPGQFLTVQVKVGGKAMVRCYSICSPPESKGFLEISVKRQGAVSGALHATLRRGSTLFVRRPAGRSSTHEDDGRPLVLLAGGVGITPLISMLRHAVVADPGGTSRWSSRSRRPRTSRSGRSSRSSLRAIRRRMSFFAVTRGATPARACTRGRVDVDLLLRITGGPARPVYCICGPAPDDRRHAAPPGLARGPRTSRSGPRPSSPPSTRREEAPARRNPSISGSRRRGAPFACRPASRSSRPPRLQVPRSRLPAGPASAEPAGPGFSQERRNARPRP